MRRIVRTVGITAVACAMVQAATGVAWAAAAPVPVVTGPADAFSPAPTIGYLAWQQNSVGNPGTYNIYAEPRAGGSAWKVNAAGTQGYGPSSIWGTDAIVYQQTTRSTSDLFQYNLATTTRKKLPAKVNTAAWEWGPAASSAYVLFNRTTSNGRQLLLWNRKANTIRELGRTKANCRKCLYPEWVGATHAIWSVCSDTCHLRIWDAGTNTVTALPDDPAPYSQYGASMDEATGDVYYVGSNWWCGLFVELRVWNIATGEAVVYELDEGVDGNSVALAPNLTTPGDLDLFYSVFTCLPEDSDIYMIESVNVP